MTTTDKGELQKCPKAYLRWAFVVAGMVFAWAGYFVHQCLAPEGFSLSPSQAEDATRPVVQASIIQTANDQPAGPSPSAFLGVEIVSVDSVIAEQLGLPSKTGVLVNSVVPNSPAQKAGLERGDVVVALNNRTTKDVDRFRDVMAELKPGDTVRIVFMRSGKKDLTYAELVEAPALRRTAQRPGPSDSGWGVSLAAISSSLRDSLDIPPEVNGVLILSVAPGGVGDRGGLMPGDIIRGVDKTSISDMQDFFQAVSSDRDDTALLDVYRQGRMRYVPMDSSGVKSADQTQTHRKDVVLTEHRNEEDDYDKPVCKRLEESGERYNVREDAQDGGI